MNLFRTAVAVSLAATVALGSSATALAAPRRYDDFEDITGHVELTVPQTLGIGSPAGGISTTSGGYYITGTSNPAEPLYLNGQQVSDRGIYGSYGVYVPLYDGENVYKFTQGGSSQTVTITRTKVQEAATTDIITNAYPLCDTAYRSGEDITFSCVAPSGADVWVSYYGGRIELTQVAAAADGVPARFKTTATMDTVAQARNGGQVKYSMSYNGEGATASSVGSLFVYPKEGDIPVQVAETVATVFKDSAGKYVSAAVKGGAVDSVADQTDDMYLLGMGSWIPKSSVTPLLEGSIENTVTGAAFSSTQYGERITLTGSGSPIASSWQNGDTLYIELYHTSGVPAIPLGGSRLFSGVDIRQEGDSTVLEFSIVPGQTLWGHSVDYDGKGTTIYCKYPPTKTGGEDKPLSDIIIGLDGGHGGSDPGAFGTARLLGPAEKDITYATALAVKKRLEKLGAKVLLTTYHDDAKSTVADRMAAPIAGKADFFISLHCNSVAGDGLKPNGVEIFHYYTRSKPFAETLLNNIVAETGRLSRGVKSNYFRVTMNSLTPAVLIEMGFASNPREYDQLCSKEGIFQMANAIGNSVIQMLN